MLTSFAIGALGLALAATMRSLENFSTVMNFVIFPMLFLSGALYPVGRLGTPLRALSYLNPLAYGVDPPETRPARAVAGRWVRWRAAGGARCHRPGRAVPRSVSRPPPSSSPGRVESPVSRCATRCGRAAPGGLTPARGGGQVRPGSRPAYPPERGTAWPDASPCVTPLRLIALIFNQQFDSHTTSGRRRNYGSGLFSWGVAGR